ncbi:hypothetical protein ACFQH3_02030 [Haladaptatus sp. GCM10025707]|nr:hypothetical protein [Haladaptatus sp. QDMS2]
MAQLTIERGEQRTACPDCGGALLNVQGLLTCHDCSWVEEQ